MLPPPKGNAKIGHRTLPVPLALAFALLVLLVLASSTSADLSVCAAGSAAGQCEQPHGVAVDTSLVEPSSGHVYVADTANNRVDVFDSAGNFLFAFGWKVNATTPEEKLQTCGPAASPPGTACQKGTPGAGAGQLSSPGSIAVDSSPSSHAVYVAEEENHRVQKFDSEGHFLLMFGKEVNSGTSGKPDLCTNAGAPSDVCKAGTQGFGAGEFNQRLEVAVGPGGTVYVVDSKVAGKDENHFQKFDSSGEPIEGPIELVGAYGDPMGLAVDSSGDLYFGESAYNSGLGGVQKFDPTGHLVTAWGEGGKVDPSGNVHAIALDPVGELFVADAPHGTFDTQILRYDPNGVKSLVFFGTGTLQTSPLALTFHHTATGDLYAAELFGEHPRVVQLALPEPGPLFVPGSTNASPIGSVRATLKVSFNAENKASKAHFQYITKKKYEEDSNSFGAGTQTTPDSAPTPADFEDHTAEATNTCFVPTESSCLEPETTYYYRAIASNVDGTVESKDKAEFTTRPPLEVQATWASEVGTDVARLHAEVNPLTLHVTGRFQYVDDATFQADLPDGFQHAKTTAGTIDFGSGESPVVRAAQLTGLDSGTTYHYRLIASDPYFPPVVSAALIFTTFAPSAAGLEECPDNEAFRMGPSAALPDCRAYELVSPLGKSSGDVITRINFTGFPTNLDQSAAAVPADGLGFTYSSYRAFANPQSAPYTDQFLATRHERGQAEEGWQSEAVDPPRSGPSLLETSVTLENAFLAFSPDFSNGWLLQETEPALAPCAPAGFADLYRRDSAGGVLTALSCAQPSLEPAHFVPELEGFSADGSHAVFRVDDALSPEASSAIVEASPTRPIYQVYESTGAGPLRLVSVLPNGEASAVDSSAGTARQNSLANHNRLQNVEQAVSADGTRVFWSTAPGGQFPTPGPLYLRLNADQRQSEVLAGECTEVVRACTVAVSGGEPAFFQKASPQGTKALYVSAGLNAGDLYEYDVAGKATRLIGEGVLGSILGASQDLGRVYFASSKATVQEQAEGAEIGKPNVYLAEGGNRRFVGTLSSGDTEALGFGALGFGPQYGSPIATTPLRRTARVSPDGASLVFMSDSPGLSKEAAAYDNTDASSPARCGTENEGGEEGICDAEVYLYDATANAGKGKLRCLSCNPSGERPSGRETAEGTIGKIGSWGAAVLPRLETQLYQPRYLSDDGKRVFFDSFDSLVLADTNGKEDVYQWEQAGAGGCTTASSSYVAASEGCLSLLSSGQSPFDSEFLDASASGSDAFFTTAEGLVPRDAGLVDIYDARVQGGFAAPLTPPAACEGEACQGPLSPPLDTTPASFAFSGPGSPTPPPVIASPKAKVKPKVKLCRKGTVRKKGKCVKQKRSAQKRSANSGEAGKSSRGTVKRKRGASR